MLVKTISLLLITASVMMLPAAAAAEDECRWSTSPSAQLAGHHVSTAGRGYAVYEETNGIDGLQRGDEGWDDTCGGQIEADRIVDYTALPYGLVEASVSCETTQRSWDDGSSGPSDNRLTCAAAGVELTCGQEDHEACGTVAGIAHAELSAAHDAASGLGVCGFVCEPPSDPAGLVVGVYRCEPWTSNYDGSTTYRCRLVAILIL